MNRFTRLYQQLDSTTSTTAKLDALEEYFRSAPPPDAAWAVALLTGQRPKGVASSRILQQLAMQAANIPEWLFEQCRAAVGDLSETISLLLPDPQAEQHQTSPLHAVMRDLVLPLAHSDEQAKASIITRAWSCFTREERFIYHKLIRGGFRVGVQRRTIARALARIAGLEPAIVEHRLSGSYAPNEQNFAALIAPINDDDRTSRPYPFFLARSIEVMIGTTAISASTDSSRYDKLGPLTDWIAEWKWDGIRAQLIRRNDTIALWSRGEELITHQFPEIASAARELPAGTVLDGELLMWQGATPLSFNALQQRLNRKAPPAPGLFDQQRVVFVAYDILEHLGTDARQLPTIQRRDLLENLHATLRDDTIRISTLITADSWDQLEHARARSREAGVEGIMLKHAASYYGTGRTLPDSPEGQGLGWLKWKIDPYTVDAVLTHAYPGSGRRATLFTDYAFSVWDDRADPDLESAVHHTPDALTPLTRAYSGLDQDEIERLDAWIRRNTTRTMGPVREVKPELVFEIAFEGIAFSKRHRSGLALRFPRILRQRTDKLAPQANTISDLLPLLNHEAQP
jgi:DNA ligase 1